MTRNVIRLVFVYLWNNNKCFEKNRSFSIIPHIFNLCTTYFQQRRISTSPFKISENKGIVLNTFCFKRKTKASSFKRSHEK